MLTYSHESRTCNRLGMKNRGGAQPTQFLDSVYYCTASELIESRKGQDTIGWIG